MALKRIGFVDGAGTVIEVSICDDSPAPGAATMTPDQWAAHRGYAAWVELEVEHGKPLRAAEAGDRLEGKAGETIDALKARGRRTELTAADVRVVKA